ncbi:MAG: complex I NDUFA9 subunit family protein [Sulfobacillus acidophilus]|uniref:Complex I NDUFA9 subunit family protein n=1 Tax=Sulfobacillus acidophilus TaxID=53633 RepID=A0A2T2WGK3_9FIRM|nr:MAG: complex I NDUFA9 subunit family protein [Sulfobacillus acidophilus]
MRVVVTGASGYVGSATVAKLCRSGHSVVAIARHKPAEPMASGVTWVPGDIRHMDLVRAFDGAQAVVHLIGIIREVPQSGITFEWMHVGATERVLVAMRAAGISRLIHMSALGTRRAAASQYHRTKWEAEQLVRSQAGVKSTILRPSLMFGGAPPFFEMLKSLAQLPRVPVPGDGRTLFQPVSVHDVATLILETLPDNSSFDLTLEVGGPERFTLNQLFDGMARRIGRPHPPKIHLPLGMVGAVARLSSILPVPITPDQLAMLTEPNVTDDDTWHRWVPAPESFSSWNAKEDPHR